MSAGHGRGSQCFAKRRQALGVEFSRLIETADFLVEVEILEVGIHEGTPSLERKPRSFCLAR